MASSSGNGEEAAANNKRKIEEEEQKPKEKEAKTGDPILDIVAAGEVKFIETWKRVTTALAEAGIRTCDDYNDNSMKWKGQADDFVELTLSVGHDTGSLALCPRYTLYYTVDHKIRESNFPDKDWGDLIAQLRQHLVRLHERAARAAVMNHLQSELANWRDLLDKIPNDKIPKFPFTALEDCRLVLEWSSADGNYIIRVDRGPTLHNRQMLDEEVSFRITTTPASDPNFAVRTCTTSVDKAIEKIAYWFTKNGSDE